MLDHAIRYADLGYAVFPCAPKDKTPLTAKGFLEATQDAEQIEAWWTARPDANIGLPTQGLLVLDLDGKDNTWLTPDLAATLAGAPLSLTANGGKHYLFRQPAGKQWRNTAGKLGPGVDTRADGGYIVVPPSLLRGGKAYRWADCLALDCGPQELPEPPTWLCDLLDGQATGNLAGVRLDAAAMAKGNAIPEGQRDSTLTSLAGTMRRVGMGQTEITAALHAANRERCNPPLPDKDIERIAWSVSRYPPDQIAVAVAESHWEQDAGPVDRGPEDPGPVPESLLRVPGFIAEVMDHCLETAPYPNVPLAFAGALALQAYLAGRKVRDQSDNRPNLYILGLAHSSAGKDWPRKLNTKIIHGIGESAGLGESFASGEGIQDALYVTPSMLFQTDELDGLLQQINKSRDGRHEGIMQMLLKMYSSSNSIYQVRRKATTKSEAGEAPKVIVQPNLVIFGTAIPNHYYEALSVRMLTNGFFARMLILDASKRTDGQEVTICDPPERVLETAAWWRDFRPSEGNLDQLNPDPRTISYSDEALAMLRANREAANREYGIAEASSDAVGTTVWGRVNEQSRKLALLYAVSQSHLTPCIDAKAVEWAQSVVMHQTRRMLFMAGANAAESPFHAACLKVLQKLREAPDNQLPHSVLLKRMKVDAKEFQNLVLTLSQQGDIELVPAGKGVIYRLKR